MPGINNPTEAGSAASPQASVGARVVRGGLSMLFGQTAVLAASFLATPFTIRLLGTEGYGLLSLILVVIDYLSFSDLGMGFGSTRFATRAHAQGDERGEVESIGTAFIIVLASVGLIILVVAAIAPLIFIRGFNVPWHQAGIAGWALRLALLGMAARLLAFVINTPLLVRLKLEVQAHIYSISAVLQVLATPIVLFALHGGVVTAVAVASLGGLLFFFGTWWFARRALPSLRLFAWNPRLVGPLLRFGAGISLTSLVGVALTSFEKLAIGRYADLKALAYYTVAFRIATLVAVGPRGMMGTLLPAFGQLWYRNARTELAQLYHSVFRGTLLWIVPVAGGLSIFGGPLLRLWIGGEQAGRALLPLQILLLGVVIELVTHVPTELIKSLGRTDLLARIAIAELPLYAVAAVLAVRHFGIVGAAYAWTLRAAVDWLLQSWMVRRITKNALWPANHPRGLWPLVILFGGAFGAAAYLEVRMILAIPFSIVVFAIYVALVWRVILRLDEREWLRVRVQRFLPRAMRSA